MSIVRKSGKVSALVSVLIIAILWSANVYKNYKIHLKQENIKLAHPKFINNRAPVIIADYVYSAGYHHQKNNVFYQLNRPTNWPGVAIIVVHGKQDLISFYNSWLPYIESKFILISLSDWSKPSDYMHISFLRRFYLSRQLDTLLFSFLTECIHNPLLSSKLNIKDILDNQYLVKWFVYNIDHTVSHSKLEGFPLGVNYHLGKLIEQDRELASVEEILQPTYKRKRKVYMDAHLANNSTRHRPVYEDRATISKQLKKNKLIEYQHKKIPRIEQWKKRGEYMFSISLIGKGYDCYRTWESLILGNIVLLQSSPVDYLFKDLPVVIIKDWSSITEENLQKWGEKYKDAFTKKRYKKQLTSKYWMDIIEKVRQKQLNADTKNTN